MSFLRGFPKHKSRYFICFLTPSQVGPRECHLWPF